MFVPSILIYLTWLIYSNTQTEIYRKVFHAIPDDLVTTWKQYKDFVVHHERMNKSVCTFSPSFFLH